MSKVSFPARYLRESGMVSILVATVVLAGCGGDSSSASDPPGGDSPPPPPAAVHGIATPTSVAVVSATNAN